jgi:hypothetical protein
LLQSPQWLLAGDVPKALAADVDKLQIEQITTARQRDVPLLWQG